jgi:hypothetical protein
MVLGRGPLCQDDVAVLVVSANIADEFADLLKMHARPERPFPLSTLFHFLSRTSFRSGCSKVDVEKQEQPEYNLRSSLTCLVNKTLATLVDRKRCLLP